MGCAHWFLVMLILCLFFGIGQVFAVFFTLVGYGILGLIILIVVAAAFAGRS